MAVQFVDSFDHYQTADLSKKYNDAGGDGADSAVITGVRYRTGCQSLRLHSNGYVSKILPTSVEEMVMGFWWYPNYLGTDLNSIGWANRLVVWSSRIEDFYVGLNQNGTLSAYRTHMWGPALMGTSVGGVTFQNGQYIEIKYKHSNTDGYVIVRRNGNVILNLSGIDSIGSNQTGGGDPLIASVALWNVPVNHYAYFDDLYLADLTGGVNDDFLGDVNVVCLHPTGNGAESQWTGSDADQVDNYALVDEDLLDTADYIESDAPGKTDTYPFQQILTGTPLAVQLNVAVNKTDVGNRFVEGVARVGGVDYTTSPLAVDLLPYILTEVMDQNPAGGAWDLATVNASEYGVHDEA